MRVTQSPNVHLFYCSGCEQSKGHVNPDSFGTAGYGEDEHGRRYCFACCAVRDLASMAETGRATLYLTGKPGEYRITNWPDSLSFIPYKARIGRHNMAGKRYDVWFSGPGELPSLSAEWHGVSYGDNTQICHCKRKES